MKIYQGAVLNSPFTMIKSKKMELYNPKLFKNNKLTRSYNKKWRNKGNNMKNN